jgi:hypothetical protein
LNFCIVFEQALAASLRAKRSNPVWLASSPFGSSQ